MHTDDILNTAGPLRGWVTVALVHLKEKKKPSDQVQHGGLDWQDLTGC